MSYNVPLLGGLCFPVILCVYLLLSLYDAMNYVKRFVSPCAYTLFCVIPFLNILLSYLLSILKKVVILLSKKTGFHMSNTNYPTPAVRRPWGTLRTMPTQSRATFKINVLRRQYKGGLYCPSPSPPGFPLSKDK
jgi:hypothetical protein